MRLTPPSPSPSPSPTTRTATSPMSPATTSPGPSTAWRRAASAAVAALALAALAGCAPVPVAPPAGVLDLAERPAEGALLAGLRAYDDAQYATAEQQLGQAIAAGLVSPRDRASAYKHLAFIYCTSDRVAACEQAFRDARAADPGFALTKSEAGHPLWGPVYRKLSS